MCNFKWSAVLSTTLSNQPVLNKGSGIYFIWPKFTIIAEYTNKCCVSHIHKRPTKTFRTTVPLWGKELNNGV